MDPATVINKETKKSQATRPRGEQGTHLTPDTSRRVVCATPAARNAHDTWGTSSVNLGVQTRTTAVIEFYVVH